MPLMPPGDKDKSAAEVEKLTYEQAVEQLEEIIDRIESGKIGLEQSLKEYERGVMLRDHCREILARTEQRVKELSAKDLDAPRGESA